MGSAQRQAWVFTGVALVGTLATFFGPSERWGGVDIGATGPTLFLAGTGALIWLFSARGDRVFPEHMSLVERRAWAGLGFIAVIFVSFVRQIWVLSLHAVEPKYLYGLFAHQFIHQLVVLIIVWSVISHVIGRGMGGVEADERDMRLRHGADRVGDWAFTLIVIAGIVVLAFVPAPLLAWWLSPIVLANLLIGLLIAKSLVEHVALALAYRGGRA
jgi:hypothetical protein